MAAGILPKPGTKLGPCKKACEHRDCAESRFIAACACRFCGKPVGYDTRFYLDRDAAPATADDRRWVHADCFEDAIEAEQAAARVHSVGCVCESCSAAYERERWDPRG